MVFKTPGLDIMGRIGQFLIVQQVRILPQARFPRQYTFIAGPDIVVVGHIEHRLQLGIRGAIGTHCSHGQHMGAVDALRQPDTAGADCLHLVPGLPPEVQRHSAGHVTAKSIHNRRPLLQRIDLVTPQVAVRIVQIYDIPPVCHLAGGLAGSIPQEELRVSLRQHGVR